jgi:hypothetical protein
VGVRGGLLLGALALCLALPATAGSLEPTQASQVVQLRTFGTTCATGSGTAIDLQTRPDGLVAFNYAIPPKQVLVVRRVSFEVAPGPGQTGISSLELGGNLIRTAIGVGDGAGVFTREFEPGLVVADVSRFCAYLQGVGSITVYATGFLARDK